MISPRLRIELTPYFEDIKKPKQQLSSKYKISLFLIKNYSLTRELNKHNSKDTDYFIFEWKILKEFKDYHETLTRLQLKIYSKRIKKHTMKKHTITEFFIYERTNEYLMVISDLNADLQKKVNKFINSYYPVITKFYLIHDELFELINILEERFKYPLEVSWCIISEKQGKRADKDIKYSKGKYFKKVFFKAREDNKFVEKIRLNNLNTYLEVTKGKPYDFKITREGDLSIYRGTFDKYFLALIELILKFAKNKYILLKDRSRYKTINKEIKPIIIDFYNPTFKNKKGIETFLKVFSEYPNCSYAIIQSGNPYLEIIFVDYTDKSSFSLSTFSNKSLIIFPQLFASGSALLKLFSFITERFSDGILYDYEDYKRKIKINI